MTTQPNTPTRAIILFAHGSSNPSWREPFDAIVERVSALAPDARVELAFLEIMSPNVNQVVRDCALDGIRHIRIVPLFFGVGKHVAEDLQKLIEAVRVEFAEIEIEIASAVGQSETVRGAMAKFAIQSD
jgi:sirohydrochlorin cobaltochelatase